MRRMHEYDGRKTLHADGSENHGPDATDTIIPQQKQKYLEVSGNLAYIADSTRHDLSTDYAVPRENPRNDSDAP